MGNKKIFYILAGAITIAVFLTVILVLRNIGGTKITNTRLQFWGVFDSRSDFDKVINEFQAQNPNITVSYQEFTYDQYEKALVDALAAGNGPDVLMIQNTWLPKHGDKIAPMPTSIPGQNQPLMTINDFKSQFVDVAYNDLTYNNTIYALPLYVDTLALYYNKDLLNTAGITRPPQDWNDFNNDVRLLTHLNATGNIIQSGAAIGTSSNINRSVDILMDLMMQSGVNMTNSDNTAATFSQSVNNQAVGETALQYYTDFANPSKQVYSWNNSQHYSIDAFTEGSVAMMFNYSHQTAQIRAKAPRLNFGIAPMPQASLSDVKNYANYWAVAVAKNSPNIDAAWEFATFLTSKDGASTYLSDTMRPSARRDLIDLQRNDPDLGVFAVQALSAHSWYEVDDTAIEGIFADMIDDVNFNRGTVREAIQRAESRVNVLMSK